MSAGHRNQLRVLNVSWNNLNNKRNNVVLDYNPKNRKKEITNFLCMIFQMIYTVNLPSRSTAV